MNGSSSNLKSKLRGLSEEKSEKKLFRFYSPVTPIYPMFLLHILLAQITLDVLGRNANSLQNF